MAKRKKKNKKKILFVVSLLAILMAAGGYYIYKRTHRHNYTFRPTKRRDDGRKCDCIDVSNHQGRIDWKKVTTYKNIQFVYIKATEGATLVDKLYARNIREARKYGLKVGSYHYLRNTSLIHDQFENFKRTAKKDLQDLLPMVDMEEDVHRDSIKAFCNLIEEYYGKQPVIYSANSWYNFYCAPDFNDHIKMIGRLGRKPSISGKGTYEIWQYSNYGYVPGIYYPVDLGRLHPDFKTSRLKL